MHDAAESYSGFCTLTAYHERTFECLVTWLIEIAARVERDPRIGAYRRVRLVYDVGHDGGRVTLEGRATGDPDDREIAGIATPLRIAVTLIHPLCTTTEIVIGARYGDGLRIDLAPAPSPRPGRVRSQPTTQEGDADPLWEDVLAILTAQTVRDQTDVSRLRRACALLFHTDAPERDRRFLDVHARANAYLDALAV